MDARLCNSAKTHFRCSPRKARPLPGKLKCRRKTSATLAMARVALVFRRHFNLPGSGRALRGEQRKWVFAELHKRASIGPRGQEDFPGNFARAALHPPYRLSLAHRPARLVKIDARQRRNSLATSRAEQQKHEQRSMLACVSHAPVPIRKNIRRV